MVASRYACVCACWRCHHPGLLHGLCDELQSPAVLNGRDLLRWLMNTYHMWFNLKDSRKDVEFAQAVDAYLGHLKAHKLIDSFRLTRRKFGFGPDGLGEFHCEVHCEDLAQLDRAFGLVATRTGEVERLHIPVYSAVTDFKSALYRDFPDPQRGQ